MVSFLGFLFIYVIGGITFLPLVALATYIYIKRKAPKLKKLAAEPSFQHEAYIYKDPDNVIMKKGWIRLTNQYQPKMPEVFNNSNSNGIIAGISSYVSNKDKDKDIINNNGQKKGVIYAVLKHGTLFCYENEKQAQVVMILPIQDFTVTLYPPKRQDATEGSMYNRMSVVRLIPNALVSQLKNEVAKEEDGIYTALSEEDITSSPTRILYLTCGRNIDKEDWYLGLVEAQHMLIGDEKNPEEAHYVMMDNTHFDSAAIEDLISQVQSSPSHRETAWINAVFGRIFLGMYKTDRLKHFIEMKIRKKIDKTKRPTFLDAITVRKVDVGGSVPFITDPKLLSLSPEGEVIVEAKVEYRGGLTIEIETDFNWSYSSRLKPIRMHLILAVKLNQMSGRMMFKIKAPPTNRFWLAFFEMPEMDWKITPVVADKQIKLSIVTNAIESRIREVMADSFVLPNMDDTSFCPSQGKGGIFGDYVKVEKRSRKQSAYVNDDLTGDDENAAKHSRENFISEKYNSGKDSMISEPPSVPDSMLEKPHSAADALKLKNRRAESAAEFAINGGHHPPTGNDLGISSFASASDAIQHQKLEVSQSTPDIHITPLATMSSASLSSSVEDSHSVKSLDQRSIPESTVSTSSKWSSAAINLRKRLKKGITDNNEENHDDRNSDTESVQSGKSGLLNKIHNLLPTENNHSSDSPSVNQAATNGNHHGNSKKNSLLQKAEIYLAKKTGYHEDDEDQHLITEEKKEAYAERMANIRRRAEEQRKRSSTSSLSSNSSIPPPPLPPLSVSPKLQQQQHYPESPISSINKSLLDDDDYTPSEKGLPAPIVPTRRERSASSIVEQKTPLLPPRRNSTPTPPADNLVGSSTNVENGVLSPTTASSSLPDRFDATPVPIQEEQGRPLSIPPSQEEQTGITPAKQLKNQVSQAEQQQEQQLLSDSESSRHNIETAQAEKHPDIPIIATTELTEEPKSQKVQVEVMPKLQPPAIPNKPRPPLPTAPRPSTTANEKPPLPNVPRPVPSTIEQKEKAPPSQSPPAVPPRSVFPPHP